jgi:hypothetical protein
MALPNTVGGVTNEGHNPPHKSSGGDYYAIIRASTQLQVKVSSDPATVAFTGADNTTTTLYVAGNVVASVSDGSYIHIVTLNKTTLILAYHRFNMSTDVFDQQDSQVADLSGMTAPLTSALWCSIALRAGVTGDELVIAASGLIDSIMGTDYQRVDFWHGADTGTPSWTGPVSLDVSTAEQTRTSPQLVLGTNDKIHVLWQTYPGANPATSGGSVAARTISTSNTLSTLQTNSSHVGTAPGIKAGVSYDDAGTQKVIWIGNYNISNTFRGDEDGSDDIGTLTATDFTDASNRAANNLSIVEVSGTLYALFANNNDGADLYTNSSDDNGATWGTPTEELDAVTLSYISADVLDTGKIAYLYVDGGTTKYNEIVLGISFASGLSGVGTSTGALTTSIQAAGALSGAATVSGTIQFPPILFDGAIIGSSTATGALSTAITFAVDVIGVATTTAALTTAISFAGAVTGTSTVTAALTTSIPLASSATGLGITAGALTTAIQLSGALTGTSTVIGQLLNDPALFAGGVAGVGQGSGALTTSITAAGALVGTTTLAGTLSTSITLSVSTTGVATTTANLDTAIALDGALSGAGVTVGGLDTIILMGGATSGASTAIGALSTAITFAGDVVGIATADGTMAIDGDQFAADVVGAGTTAAALTTSITLAGSITGVASTIAGLDTIILMGGATSGITSVTGDLTTQIQMAGTVVGQSAITAQLQTLIECDGSATGLSTTTASLSTAIPLSASAVGVGAVTADLAVAVDGFSAAVVGVGVVTGALNPSPTAWEILVEGSTASPESTAWVHLNNQAGGDIVQVYVVATEAITSELAAIEGVAPIAAIVAGSELSTLSKSGSIKSLSSTKELG